MRGAAGRCSIDVDTADLCTVDCVQARCCDTLSLMLVFMIYMRVGAH